MAGSGHVQTVLGAIAPELLGITLTHEHLLINLTRPLPTNVSHQERSRYYDSIRLNNHFSIRRDHFNHEDQQLTSVEDAIEELEPYKVLGGRTLVDATLPGIGRNPLGLQEISRATGVRIVMGCGYYVSEFHPPSLSDRSESDIYEELIMELLHGVGPNAIKPGVIGEIGLSWPPHEDEMKVLRAAARAQAESGVVLLVHPGRNPQAPIHHVRLIEQAGADPSRCIISHIDRTLFTLEDMLELAQTGCYLELDLFGREASFYASAPIDMPNDAMRVNYLVELALAGHARQLLISQDICHKTRLVRYGGEGYSHILNHVVPLMHRKGLTESDINLLMIHNPARALTQHL